MPAAPAQTPAAASADAGGGAGSETQQGERQSRATVTGKGSFVFNSCGSLDVSTAQFHRYF